MKAANKRGLKVLLEDNLPIPKGFVAVLCVGTEKLTRGCDWRAIGFYTDMYWARDRYEEQAWLPHGKALILAGCSTLLFVSPKGEVVPHQ